MKRVETIRIQQYSVQEAGADVLLKANWNDTAWARANTDAVRHFRPESSDHRPTTFFRVLHHNQVIHGLFRVEDRFVRCTRTAYQSEVWKDSCVEFFAQPKAESGYFNFEFNCGGAFLCCYIVNPERTADGFKEYTRIPEAIGSLIQVKSTLPEKIDVEITEPITWTLQFKIPLAVFEEYVGPVGPLSGQTWSGNFFKCAEELSHPHWASWSRVDEFNFHLPRCFGIIRFA